MSSQRDGGGAKPGSKRPRRVVSMDEEEDDGMTPSGAPQGGFRQSRAKGSETPSTTGPGRASASSDSASVTSGSGSAVDAVAAVSSAADDPLMRDDPLMAGSGAPADAGTEREALPEVMVNIFKSATLAEIRAANRANGITTMPQYLRPSMNFAIVPRAPSMLSRIFEMIAAVLSRAGGRESGASIGFTVIMLNGHPQVAVDLGDERFTFVISVRILADIYVRDSWAGTNGQFPVLRVRCRSMVEKLSQAKDFNRVILYQQAGTEDQLEIIIDTPERSGNVQHETVKIQADDWDALELDNITHDFTLQTTIKTMMQLCRMQRDGQGHMSISIYTDGGRRGAGSGVGGGGPDSASVMSSSSTPHASSRLTSLQVSRERQEFILKLDVTNAEGETSTVLRPITNDVERRMDTRTNITTTTMHVVEDGPASGLDLMEKLRTCTKRYQQSFSTGYIDAFLSKFDQNKMVAMRLAADKPMVLSYSHGGLLVCQMVVSPVFEEEEQQ
jgi:hypothetical protein